MGWDADDSGRRGGNGNGTYIIHIQYIYLDLDRRWTVKMKDKGREIARWE